MVDTVRVQVCVFVCMSKLCMQATEREERKSSQIIPLRLDTKVGLLLLLLRLHVHFSVLLPSNAHSRLLPLANPKVHASVQEKAIAKTLGLDIGPDNLPVKPHDHFGNRLLELQAGQRASQAAKAAVAKHERLGLGHAGQAVGVALEEPARGAEDVGVGPEDAGVVHQPPAVPADMHAAGDEAPVGEHVAAGRDLLGQARDDGRVHAQALADDGLQVGQAAGLAVGEDGAVEAAGRQRGVELLAEGLEDGGVGEDVVERHADAGRGAVAANRDLDEGFALELRLREALGHEAAQHVFVLDGVVAEALAHHVLRECHGPAHARLGCRVREQLLDEGDAEYVVEFGVVHQHVHEGEGFLDVLDVAEGIAVGAHEAESLAEGDF